MAPSAANRPSVVALTRGPGGNADGAGGVAFAAQKFGGVQKPAARPVTMDPFAKLPHKSVTGAELEQEIAELNDLIGSSQRNSASSHINRPHEEVTVRSKLFRNFLPHSSLARCSVHWL